MKTVKKIIFTFATWRIGLLIFGFLLVGFPGFLNSLANFDGHRYLNIAQLGYGTPQTYYSYSLFPLYPTLIKNFSFLGGYFFSGIIISNLCFFLSLFVIYKLFRLDLNNSLAFFAVVLMLIFPSSFILGSIYSESLFLLLSVSSVYLARKNNFFWAVILAMFASHTRSAGLFVWILIVIEYFQQNKFLPQKIFNLRSLVLLVPPLGVLTYINYVFINTSNLSFVLPSIPEKFVFLHQIFIRYARMVLLVDHTSSLFLVVATEAFVGFVGLLVIILSYKYLRTSYWVYLIASYLVPSLWGNFVGYPRFLIVVFPLFIFLSQWLEKQHPFIRYAYIAISSILLLINFTLFTKGVFVG